MGLTFSTPVQKGGNGVVSTVPGLRDALLGKLFVCYSSKCACVENGLAISNIGYFGQAWFRGKRC
jgi:hypothetical protein